MTLKQEAQKGIVTDVMREAARHEGLSPEMIRQGIATGRIVIPKNANRDFSAVRAVGEGTRTKVNANIGASPLRSDLEEELDKLAVAENCGADAVMDLSLGPDQLRIRRAILERSRVMVGSVPIYQSAFELSAARRDVTDMRIGDFLKTVRRQAEEGVDFMTIHCGVTRRSLAAMEGEDRVLDVVSRGGAMLVAWMRENRKESPLYEHYDEILDILAENEVTLSLGDGMRPGALADAGDRAQMSELFLLGELTQRAWEKGVQVIIEGPGHVPLNQVAEQMLIEKRLCAGAPFYVLGPLVTDIAAGYDHIAGAIGGAVAAMNGADFLCYVTPAEHLRLPTVSDVAEGVIASRIAAHAADLARGLPAAWERDREMSRARKSLDWNKQIALSIDPEKARACREESGIGNEEACTMCGAFCAIKRLQQVEG